MVFLQDVLPYLKKNLSSFRWLLASLSRSTWTISTGYLCVTAVDLNLWCTSIYLMISCDPYLYLLYPLLHFKNNLSSFSWKLAPLSRSNWTISTGYLYFTVVSTGFAFVETIGVHVQVAWWYHVMAYPPYPYLSYPLLYSKAISLLPNPNEHWTWKNNITTYCFSQPQSQFHRSV